MFCDFCIAADVPSDKTAFISGCSNFRLETIKHHESSNSHLFAVERHANEQNPTDAPAHKAKLSLNKAIYTMLSLLFAIMPSCHIKCMPSTFRGDQLEITCG